MGTDAAVATATAPGSPSNPLTDAAGLDTSVPVAATDAGSGQSSAPALTDAQSAPQSPSNPGAVTYQRDIRPLLEANCVECHTKGGIGPSALDDWSTVKSLGSVVVHAVSSGDMPPWPADDTCHPIANSRALSQASRELFMRWQADGFQEGNAADYVPPPKRARPELGPADVMLQGDEAFTPADNGDTFRCFFAGTVAEDTYITALDIVPLARAEVHHVQLHRVAAADVATVRSTDQSAAGGGYPCNSAGVGTFVQSQNLFSYRPGGDAVVFEPGDAVYLKGGSGLVLQVHYNTQFLPAGEHPTPDHTMAKLWTMPKGKTPERVIYRTGLLSPLNGSSKGDAYLTLSTSIPANATNITGETTLKMSGVSVLGSGLNLGAVTGRFIPGEIVGMTPHAHAWATRLTATLTPSGGAEQCLIDIPRWDYDWQLDYIYPTGVPFGPNDVLHVACEYDNSAAHQPIINGVRRQSQTITFGESTLNEMCEHYLWLRFSYDAFKAASP